MAAGAAFISFLVTLILVPVGFVVLYFVVTAAVAQGMKKHTLWLIEFRRAKTAERDVDDAEV